MNKLRVLDISRELKSGDVFFQPEIFQDSRIEWMNENFPKFEGVKKVAVFYDALNWSHPHLSATGRLVRFEHYLKALSCFDRVASISDFSTDALVKFWKEEFCKGPEPDRIYPVLSWKKRRAGKPISRRRPVIPYVATLEPRKNHFALLDACCRLWDDGCVFDLVLVGKEGPGQGHQIARKIRQIQKQDKPLYWRPGLSDAGVKRLYRNALFSVYPSMVEGFGLPVLESLWFGTPCLCHTEGAVDEVAQAGGCLQVDARYVENIADGFHRLLNDTELLRRLAREAKERDFRNWSDYVEELRTLW
jgi:glycosyltransferase involved in cell wall biosynthesis